MHALSLHVSVSLKAPLMSFCDMLVLSIPLQSKLCPFELLLSKLKLILFIDESKLMLFLFIIESTGNDGDLPRALVISEGEFKGNVAGVGGNDSIVLRSPSSSSSLSWLSELFLEE